MNQVREYQLEMHKQVHSASRIPGNCLKHSGTFNIIIFPI